MFSLYNPLLSSTRGECSSRVLERPLPEDHQTLLHTIHLTHCPGLNRPLCARGQHWTTLRSRLSVVNAFRPGTGPGFVARTEALPVVSRGDPLCIKLLLVEFFDFKCPSFQFPSLFDVDARMESLPYACSN